MLPSCGRVILASASPRRKMLLEKAGLQFEIIPSEAREHTPADGEDPHLIAIDNAAVKALDIAALFPEAVVIGADTIVVSAAGRIMGKPVDEDDAFAILSDLAGTTQNVITGVAVIRKADNTDIRFADETAVTMRSLSSAEIRAYIATGEPFGKAGAYAIQENADAFVESIEGDYDNVVGLPVKRVLDALAEIKPLPS